MGGKNSEIEEVWEGLRESEKELKQANEKLRLALWLLRTLTPDAKKEMSEDWNKRLKELI